MLYLLHSYECNESKGQVLPTRIRTRHGFRRVTKTLHPLSQGVVRGGTTCCIPAAGCSITRAELGFNMYLLDIGGGFPGSEDVKLKFEEITSVINPALDKYFPSDSGINIIAEPGRYYVASAFTLAVNIIAKKIVLKEQTGSDDEDDANDKTLMYYVNDGVYGSFNCILYDHAHVKPVLQKRPKPDDSCYSCSIWGPTCDGLDRIVERFNMPELQVGDWILFENMGAYTVAAASTFNGFQRPTIHYVMSRPAWLVIKYLDSSALLIWMTVVNSSWQLAVS
ncbi:ornithine decarboxylase [Limosa lapponica baueri]|uniref:ornithine decarboxylase n=1 Tax=Limosa lapponica baueri TaxID=1758121 RepID=A0A2I0UA84_LIMLA|nr:ornithine decarboxylase [Limosa lapponica baueri]